MNRYAVFGQPIAHSLSPSLHAMFGAQLGIPVDYRAIEAGRDDFPHALAAFAHAGGVGANVTLPLKEDAAALCISLGERARQSGSVNTLIRDGEAWRGDSTDGVGLLRDLSERHGFDVHNANVLLLGAGGAARAAAFALADAGSRELVIANRTLARAETLAIDVSALARASMPARTRACAWSQLDRLSSDRIAPFDLVVNATSAGHAARVFDAPHALAAGTRCYDLSYGKAAAAFLDWARDAQASQAQDGLGMLVEQAAESFFLWHGQRPDTAPVYATLRGN